MNDTDYIRKAVELADGDCFFCSETGIWSAITQFYGEQPYLDALAAQLVRQVSAIPRKYHGDTQVSGVDMIIHLNMTYISTSDHWISRQGRDIAMNTIKAIVDSGVLDTDREGQ